MMRNIAILFSLLFIFTGCSQPKPCEKFNGSKRCPAAAYEEKNYKVDKNAKVQTGKASYYASCFSGRRTASGETCNINNYTAAHRTLPFGTMIRVTMLSNGKSVIVKVNDRGPYSRGRIVDLSQAAAKMIGLVRAGVARVKIERVHKL
jgi:rare lipoprotein A (peptidoglycan hydrolase)